jgi:hypothetical protein
MTKEERFPLTMAKSPANCFISEEALARKEEYLRNPPEAGQNERGRRMKRETEVYDPDRYGHYLKDKGFWK